MRAARLHLWLGEWQMASSSLQDARGAQWHFSQVRRLAPATDPLHGAALYDTAIAHYEAGEYRAAADAFMRLLSFASPLRGYDRRRCALWERHAAACAGYHEQHARLGIPEPPRLDPLCGPAGLATCLRALGMPYDQKMVLSVCRMTGRGSTLQDIADGAKKLGLTSHAMIADEAGLRALPKPLVGFVENDHFVAVVRADEKGVSYLCADCGCWPGGQVNLTWRQWRAMEAGLFLSISRPGSAADRLVAAATEASGPARLAHALGRPAPGLQVASSVTGGPGLGALSAADAAARALAPHVTAFLNLGSVVCGRKLDALHCPAMLVKCPMDAPDGTSCKGDPVNLATGEEEYAPPPDLVVYNPAGPAVVWGRVYNSLRSPDGTYPCDDFGMGWSHTYNIYVLNPSSSGPAVAPTAAAASAAVSASDVAPIQGDPIPVAGIDIPLPAYTWEGASGGAGTGWDGFPIQGGPYLPWHPLPINPFQPVTPPPPEWGPLPVPLPVLPGQPAPPPVVHLPIIGPGIPLPGDPAPGDPPYIGGGGGRIGLPPLPWPPSLPPWGQDPNQPAPQPPPNPPAVPPGGGGNVLDPWSFYDTAPARYLVLPNGARIPIWGQPPTASLRLTHCIVPPGAPFTVDWIYEGVTVLLNTNDNTTAAAAQDYFIIRFMNGTEWMTEAPRQGNIYPLHSISDPGGTLLLGYDQTHTDATGLPLLSQISSANSIALVSGGVTPTGGTVLLTIHRDSSGAINSVADCYGRSVFYHVGGYTGVNTTTYPELDSVSQVTTDASAPDAYTYGYTNVPNGDGGEQLPFLHTISVPSPTGSGTSTTTIEYTQVYDPTTKRLPGYVQSITDANGNRHLYTSPAGSNVTDVTVSGPTGTASRTVEYTYNGYMAVASVADITNPSHPRRQWAAGYGRPNLARPTSVAIGAQYKDPNTPFLATNITYDNLGLPTDVQLPTGGHISVVYEYGKPANPVARVQYLSTPAGGAHYSYNETNGLVSQIDNLDFGTTAFTYTAGNQLQTISQTKPDSSGQTQVVATFHYDQDGAYSQTPALGEPVAVDDALGRRVHLRYDERGNLAQLIDVHNRQFDINYNVADQPVTGLDPFDPRGQRTGTTRTYLFPGGALTGLTVFNGAGQTLRQANLAYGAEGELLGVTGNVTGFSCTYDFLYRRRTLTDNNEHTTRWDYDDQNNAVTVTYPAGDTAALQFNDLDQPWKRYGASGNLAETFGYDANTGLLTAVTYGADTTPDVQYAYDSLGRLSGIQDATGGTTFQRVGGSSLLTNAITSVPGSSVTNTVHYEYYPDGSRKSMTFPGGTNLYSYDALGRLSSLLNASNERTAWTYGDNGYLSLQTLANGASTSYQHDSLGRLARLTNYGPSAAPGTDPPVLSDYTNLSYDGEGRLTGYAVDASAAPDLSGQATFGYDGLGRISLDAFAPVNPGPRNAWNNTFAYDGAGNATTFRNQSGIYYDADNREGDGVHYHYGYTPDGFFNSASSGYSLFDYDVEGRIVHSSDAPGAMGWNGSFLYDGLGRLAYSNGHNDLTYVQPPQAYVYDGDQLLETEGVVTAPTYRANTFGATGLVSSGSPGTPAYSTFYQFDPLGNVVHTLAPDGSVRGSAQWDAYGNGGGGISGPFGYKGQLGCWSGPTGLLHCGARDYDPGAGRWLTPDPIGYAGGLNRYLYCGGDPVNFADPAGLWRIRIPGINGDPGLVFDSGDIGNGLATGAAATGSAFSFGLWDGGQWRCQPGFGTSSILAGIGRDALLAAAGMGDGPGAVGELEEVGSAARVAEEEGDAAATAQECADGMQCFAPGTPVQMADGTTKPIEVVKVGDSVLSRDQDDTAGTGKVTAHKVVQTFQSVVPEGTVILHLVGGESVEVTPGHRFFVEGRGFTQASLIAVGNAIVTRAGPSTGGSGKPSSVVVERIEVKPGRATVYNLAVEGSHTFFVGKTEGGLWTHNAGCNNKIADSIANGHAYVKHVINEGQWGGMNFRTRQQFADFVDEIINNPDAVRSLNNGRTAYWNNETATVVIHNPNAADLGTTFQPSAGINYFNNLK